MAEPQPASEFTFERPGTGTPVKSEEVRKNFNALAVLFRTDDEAFPEIKRDGMPRFNVKDPNNIRLQIWFDNAFRTIIQKIQLGIPAPAKLESIFDPVPVGNTWTIDHNLGTRPLVQVFDLTLRQLETLNPVQSPQQELALGFIPQPILTLVGGPTNRDSAAQFAGRIVGAFARVVESLTGAPNFTLQPHINGAPVTGGTINVIAPQGLGTRLPGTPVTTNNTFVAGDTLEMLFTSTVLPALGSIETYLVVERGLNAGQYFLTHSTVDRVVITHPVPTAGIALLIG